MNFKKHHNINKPETKTGKQEICNLECKKTKKPKEEKKEEYPQIHEFRGPVRLVVVDPPDEPDHECRITAAGFISMANIAVGANFFIFLVYSMGFIFDVKIDAHMLLCSFGFQVLLPLSILMHNPLYGAAGPLSDTQRTWEHCKFLVLMLLCVAFGEALPYEHTPTKKSVLAKVAEKLPFNRLHIAFGNSATFFYELALISGIVLIVSKKTTYLSFCPQIIFNCIHSITGFCTLHMGSICFILSLFTPTFQVFMFISASLVPTVVMILFVVFYNIVFDLMRGSLYKD